MPTIPGINVFIEPAEIYAAYEESRLVDVKWLSMEGTRRSVVVVNNVGNTSMPQPGDRGLVIGTGNHFYFLGKIEYNYKSKVAGTYVNPDTGKNEAYKQVEAGEVYITNTKTKSWMNLSNSGDMALFNGFMEGFKYLANLRFPKLIGKTAGLVGNGVKFAIGTATRNVPSVGEQPVVGSSGGKALEALLQIAYMGIQTVRFHLGEITDLTTGLIPELGPWGARLKAILEVTASLVTLGSIKIDELGNIQVKSTTGQVSLEGIPVAGVLLGGLLNAVHPAVYGDVLLTQLNILISLISTHTHEVLPTPLPTSGNFQSLIPNLHPPATVPAPPFIPILPTILSPTVFMS